MIRVNNVIVIFSSFFLLKYFFKIEIYTFDVEIF